MAFITIDGYPMDLVETEEHSLTTEISEFPVEDGSDISDNIRVKPRELTLTNAVVSDTPIGAIALDDTRILGETLPSPSKDAYRRLEAIVLARRVVTVVTDLKKYDNMAIETLTVPREHKDAGGLVFTVHLKELRIVKNKRVTMAVPNTGGENNLGLSLDRIIDGKRVLWRKGKPPGTSPSTVPAGVIYAQEIVTNQDGGKRPGKLLHASGKALTTDELNAFVLDLNRDSALSQHRAFARIDQKVARNQAKLNAALTPAERAQAMSEYQNDHPGQAVDPEGFGLKSDGNGGFVNAF